jgi:hypothetical protein
MLITQVPIHFLLAVSAISILIWLAIWWIHAERITSLNSLLGMYKERYGSLSEVVGQSPIGRVRNGALKQRAVQIAIAITEIASRLDTDSTQIPSPGGVTTIHEIGNRHIAVSNSAREAYSKTAKADAILVKAEIEARLASRGIKDNAPREFYVTPGMFEEPTNAICYRMVADELRRLAALLP